MSKDSEERYLDLARRVGDGGEIDWDSEQDTVSQQDSALVQRLRALFEMGRVHREVHAAESHEPPEPLPEKIGTYRIRGRLGSGGLGVVYEAEQPDSRRPVALKVIRGARASDPEAIRIFDREARTLSRLHHPSIAGIYDSGCTADGQHFLAMELVRGRTLNAWRADRSESGGESGSELRLRLHLFRQVCEALAYAHECHVIHKDLKPSNILVLDESSAESTPSIKVLDFGLARATFLSGITDPGRIRGTLPYMSPEQARGAPDEISAGTDIYSLGIILYELLTDARPYDLDQDTFLGKVQAILTTPPKPLDDVWTGGASAGPVLEAIIRRTLEKEPARRYPTARALIEELDRWEPSRPPPASSDAELEDRAP